MIVKNSPDALRGMVCDAIAAGATVRYVKGAWLSDEGFEVRSTQRTVQLTGKLTRVAGGGPNDVILLVTEAKLNGRKYRLADESAIGIIAELAAATSNR